MGKPTALLGTPSDHTITAAVHRGTLTMPDGQTIDLTKIQAAINFGYQETGEQELMEAGDQFSRLTGMTQGPSGEFVAAETSKETPDGTLTLSELYAKWDQLADVPIDDHDAIEVPFRHFAKGADREAIWHWFEQQHPGFRVADVQRGICRVDAPSPHAAAQEPKADPLARLADLLATHEVVLGFDHDLMEPRIALCINDMEITNPALSECGRLAVDPHAAYGLDPQKLEVFNALNTLLKDAVQIALDAGCAHTQQHLGVKTGDTAGTYFSFGSALNTVTQALGDYLALEIRGKARVETASSRPWLQAPRGLRPGLHSTTLVDNLAGGSVRYV